MRKIFSTVLGPHEPAFTVGSLAISATRRPPTNAIPVTTPSAPSPSASQLASSASSANDSGSTSRATRSRTGILPCSGRRSRYLSGPPASARSSASPNPPPSVVCVLVVDRDRFVTAVIVKAPSGLTAEVACCNELAKRRRRREAAFTELVEHDLPDRMGRVEAHEVEQLEGAHGVVRAALHRGVDLLDR